MFKSLHYNVFLLTFSQAFVSAIGPLVVFVGSFVGLKLAPNESLATLPVACMVVGVAMFTLPVVKIISLLGRKKGFMLIVGFGAVNSLLTAYSIYLGDFWLFCVSIALFGASISAAQQYRFAAMESVSPDKAGQAVSTLLLAGLAAAFIGPEIGFWGKSWFAVDYVGSFLLMSLCFVIATLSLIFYQPTEAQAGHAEGEIRPLSEIVKQPVFMAALCSGAVGFAVMSFIMTATPISMHIHHSFSVEDTKWVIQSHVIAMYLPSIFTGVLIRKWGAARVISAGIVIYFICLFVGFVEQQYVHYWAALVLLGLGWNFMFVTATSILPQSYNKAEKFKVQGINDFVTFSSQAIASLSAGWVIHIAGWEALLMLNIPFLLMVIGVLIYWIRSTSTKNSPIQV